MEVLLSRLCIPAYVAVTGRTRPRRCGEPHEGQDLIIRFYEVPQLGAGQGRIAEVVVPVDVFVPEGARIPVRYLDAQGIVAGISHDLRLGQGQKRCLRLLQVIVCRPLRSR